MFFFFYLACPLPDRDLRADALSHLLGVCRFKGGEFSWKSDEKQR